MNAITPQSLHRIARNHAAIHLPQQHTVDALAQPYATASGFKPMNHSNRLPRTGLDPISRVSVLSSSHAYSEAQNEARPEAHMVAPNNIHTLPTDERIHGSTRADGLHRHGTHESNMPDPAADFRRSVLSQSNWAIDGLEYPDMTTSRPIEVHGQIRILVADDNEQIRHAIVEALDEHREFAVVGVAGNGLEAVEAVRNLRPDIVLMDISMPRMNGIEATAAVQKIAPQTRVIALSIHSADELGHLMGMMGAAAYVQKTGPTSQLINAIRRLGAASNRRT